MLDWFENLSMEERANIYNEFMSPPLAIAMNQIVCTHGGGIKHDAECEKADQCKGKTPTAGKCYCAPKQGDNSRHGQGVCKMKGKLDAACVPHRGTGNSCMPGLKCTSGKCVMDQSAYNSYEIL